jgi:hypothetical protein
VAQASALGLPYGQPQPPNRLSPSWDTTNHGGVQREVSEQSRIFLEKDLEFFIGLIPGPPPENGGDSGPGSLRPMHLLGVESCPQRFGLRRPDLQVRIGGKADRVCLDTEYLPRGAKYRQARNYNVLAPEASESAFINLAGQASQGPSISQDECHSTIGVPQLVDLARDPDATAALRPSSQAFGLIDSFATHNGRGNR